MGKAKIALEICLEVQRKLAEKTKEKKTVKYKRIAEECNVSVGLVTSIVRGTHWSCEGQEKIVDEKKIADTNITGKNYFRNNFVSNNEFYEYYKAMCGPIKTYNIYDNNEENNQ